MRNPEVKVGDEIIDELGTPGIVNALSNGKPCIRYYTTDSSRWLDRWDKMPERTYVDPPWVPLESELQKITSKFKERMWRHDVPFDAAVRVLVNEVAAKAYYKAIDDAKQRINDVSSQRKRMKQPNPAAEHHHQEGMGQAWGLVHELVDYLSKPKKKARDV